MWDRGLKCVVLVVIVVKSDGCLCLAGRVGQRRRPRSHVIASGVQPYALDPYLHVSCLGLRFDMIR
jgi:hypothetical protein